MYNIFWASDSLLVHGHLEGGMIGNNWAVAIVVVVGFVDQFIDEMGDNLEKEETCAGVDNALKGRGAPQPKYPVRCYL